MSDYTVSDEANARIDEILDYTRTRWGERQADVYLDGLTDRFEAIAAHHVLWRAIPAQLGVDGYFCRYERHFIYWKELQDGTTGIVTVLHERMEQTDAVREAFED